MVQFTERCEEAIKTNSLHSFRAEMLQQLESYTNVDMGSGAPGADKDPTVVVLELKLKALILDCIHNIEVTEILEKNGVRDTMQWSWQKQLR
jgi:dynein heavy chain 2